MFEPSRRVSLVGLPGSGKTTVARQLSKRLGVSFLDSDQLIEAELGCKIKEYFTLAGEDAFRNIEEITIARLVTLPGVISTGGGAVLRASNRHMLVQYSTVVYLHATPEDLFRRLRHDTQRPLLQVADPLQKLRDLYAERDPLYRKVADFVIETGRPSVATLVNMIVMQLEMAGPQPDTKIL